MYNTRKLTDNYMVPVGGSSGRNGVRSGRRRPRGGGTVVSGSGRSSRARKEPEETGRGGRGFLSGLKQTAGGRGSEDAAREWCESGVHVCAADRDTQRVDVYFSRRTTRRGSLDVARRAAVVRFRFQTDGSPSLAGTQRRTIRNNCTRPGVSDGRAARQCGRRDCSIVACVCVCVRLARSVQKERNPSRSRTR